MTDRYLWKHYLPSTTVAAGKNGLWTLKRGSFKIITPELVIMFCVKSIPFLKQPYFKNAWIFNFVSVSTKQPRLHGRLWYMWTLTLLSWIVLNIHIHPYFISGDSIDVREIRTFCSADDKPFDSLFTSSNALTITFQSDSYGSDKGFLTSVTAGT